MGRRYCALPRDPVISVQQIMLSRISRTDSTMAYSKFGYRQIMLHALLFLRETSMQCYITAVNESIMCTQTEKQY